MGVGPGRSEATVREPTDRSRQSEIGDVGSPTRTPTPGPRWLRVLCCRVRSLRRAPHFGATSHDEGETPKENANDDDNKAKELCHPLHSHRGVRVSECKLSPEAPLWAGDGTRCLVKHFHPA